MSQTVLYVVTIFTVLLIIQFFLFRMVKSLQKPKEVRPLDELLTVLTATMKHEFEMRYKLEYELRDLTMVYDFGKDLTEITHATLEAFNPNYLKEIEEYYNREYIIKYVTRHVEIMLIEFIKEKKIKTK